MFILLFPVATWGQTDVKKNESDGFSYLVRPSFTFLMSTAQTKNAEELVLSMYGQLRSQMSFDLDVDPHIINLHHYRSSVMSRIKKSFTVILLLTLIGSVAWALADTKSVNFLFKAVWEVDSSLPGGGVLVSRGEGTNGVVTVELPMPPPSKAVDPPIKLTASDVSYMDITVEDETGATRHYGTEQKESVNYRFELEYEWDNGITQKYLLENTVASK
ncbi:MAG: hypothetical protein WBQ23_08585 [Bacteroidota bacterium]